MNHANSSDANVLRAVQVTTTPEFDFAAHPWTECPEHMPFVFQQSDLAVETQTHLRVLYDDQRLYVGIACELTKPASPAGPLGYQGEHIELFLDPANKQESSLQFAVNVSGGMSAIDHHQPESATTQLCWWAGWSAQTRSSEKSWETLIAIPLPRPMRAGEIWGLNVFRCHATPSGVSSWCPYSSGFDLPAEFGNLAFGDATVSLPAHRRPVRWPARVPDKPLEYHLTIDPPDDFMGSDIDPERLEGYFRFFANLGIKRAYWIDYGPYTDPSFMKILFRQHGGQSASDRTDRSLATFNNDPLPAAIAAAHKVGMELYCEVKPWDWGFCQIYPPNRQLAGVPGLERVGGLAYPLQALATEHPDWNMMRSPSGDQVADLGWRTPVTMRRSPVPSTLITHRLPYEPIASPSQRV